MCLNPELCVCVLGVCECVVCCVLCALCSVRRVSCVVSCHGFRVSCYVVVWCGVVCVVCVCVLCVSMIGLFNVCDVHDVVIGPAATNSNAARSGRHLLAESRSYAQHEDCGPPAGSRDRSRRRLSTSIKFRKHSSSEPIAY